ncbi:MAG TPA: hypothetical protein PKD51_14105, partial [Saprospiraceae bacterium]|nr:hypothetical protein [Saprospiraceae bacterium]
MRHIFLLFYVCLSFWCHAQKEDYIWLGGYDYDNDINDTNRVEGYRINFNNKPLEIENDISF